ncbi:2-phosphosulfolactate phosphatase [Bacteroidota bacterium]
MKSIEVCLTPQLAHQFSFEDKTAVIVDILRATSCFVTGLASGILSIRTVSTVDECLIWQDKGYIGAAERGGMKVDGFTLGNSPFEYMNENLVGKRVVATTTNGTVAIEKSGIAKRLILASFLNISAVGRYLQKSKEDVIIVCAGWEGQVNLEDTVFAGALIDKLSSTHQTVDDASKLSLISFKTLKKKLNESLLTGEHALRLIGLNLRKDIEYCLQWDLYDVVPQLRDGEFTA